jgi:hypothetical protein
MERYQIQGLKDSKNINSPQLDVQIQWNYIIILAHFFDNDKLIIKFIWNWKRLRTAKQLSKKNKVRILVKYCPKDRQINQQNTIVHTV